MFLKTIRNIFFIILFHIFEDKFLLNNFLTKFLLNNFLLTNFLLTHFLLTHFLFDARGIISFFLFNTMTVHQIYCFISNDFWTEPHTSKTLVKLIKFENHGFFDFFAFFIFFKRGEKKFFFIFENFFPKKFL